MAKIADSLNTLLIAGIVAVVGYGVYKGGQLFGLFKKKEEPVSVTLPTGEQIAPYGEGTIRSEKFDSQIPKVPAPNIPVGSPFTGGIVSGLLTSKFSEAVLTEKINKEQMKTNNKNVIQSFPKLFLAKGQTTAKKKIVTGPSGAYAVLKDGKLDIRNKFKSLPTSSFETPTESASIPNKPIQKKKNITEQFKPDPRYGKVAGVSFYGYVSPSLKQKLKGG